MIDIPVGLLEAISADGGGRLALVIGAGCSIEPPTAIPLARDLSADAARRLVMDGVLVEGECTDPTDLAALASLVFKKTGSQEALVSRFPLKLLKMAKPNLGYRLLAALMSERAISYVLSLNFDLAVQNAAADLGAPIEVVDMIGQPIPATPTLVHLHGSANGPSESLVLRQESIDDAWRDSWEQVVAQQILAAPSILFVGLGSAAPVLTETISMITDAVAGAKAFYQADVALHGGNQFTNQLSVPADRYIRGGWSEVLQALANRIVNEQSHTLGAVGTQVLRDNQYAEEDVARFRELVDRLPELSLLALGKMRGYLRLDTKRTYLPRSLVDEELLAEPMATLALICNQVGLFARPTQSGMWILERDEKPIVTVLLATGGGVRRLSALEPSMRHICASIREGSTSGPDMILISATLPEAAQSAPKDIVADEDTDDLIGGMAQPTVFLTDAANLADQVEQWLNGT